MGAACSIQCSSNDPKVDEPVKLASRPTPPDGWLQPDGPPVND